jgi:hypothetical protein
MVDYTEEMSIDGLNFIPSPNKQLILRKFHHIKCSVYEKSSLGYFGHFPSRLLPITQ